MADQKYRNAIPAGEKIGNYRVEKILGQGGFGITYLVIDEKLDRELAIKEYFPTEYSRRETNGEVIPQSDEDEKIYAWGLERFLSEGKTLAKFKHPNIVRVIGYLEENNTAYIIMEYEHGNDLQNILKEKKVLSIDEALQLFLPLLDGLSLVHKAGYIHRDIKPANIFIREDGSPVLIDFGSARQGLGVKTKTLTTLVSPGYAPFEQYNTDNSTKQGPWTDIYSLGASLYKTLFGRSPLDAVSRAEKKLAGQDDPYMTAKYVGKDHYPAQILHAIDKAMEFLPEDRPQYIEDWVAILNTVDINTEKKMDNLDTIKIETLFKDNSKQDNIELHKIDSLEDARLKLAITKYIVIGMMTLWSYTSYTLCRNIIKFASSISSISIDSRMRFIFSSIYILCMLLVLSWIVPNVFMGYVIGEGYILKAVLISSLLFYFNTLAFVLWYMKQIKRLDIFFLENRLDQLTTNEDKTRTSKNKLITKWESIDNHVVLFLVLSMPIIFSPYFCAKLFYNSSSEYILIALPIIVMLLGGIFHIWGTRLLINTYNYTLIK